MQSISPLVGDAGVSIEVFADLGTRAEQMLAQGEEMFSWIPNAYVKYPCTHEGLRAAQMSVHESIRVNMTLCFSQEQAAAVYAATKGSKEPVYVSPFAGRLDDRGEDGMGLVGNIKKMYERSDGHVHVLAASIRSVNHLLCSFALGAELATVPSGVLDEWAAAGFPMPDQHFRYQGVDAGGNLLKVIPYKELDLNLPWESFDIAHQLTTKSIQKFVADYQSTLRRSAQCLQALVETSLPRLFNSVHLECRMPRQVPDRFGDVIKQPKGISVPTHAVTRYVPFGSPEVGFWEIRNDKRASGNRPIAGEKPTSQY